MKHITWIGPIDVVPAGEQTDGDVTQDVKELILHDPESGEVIHYKMTQELCDRMGRKMKSSNRMLEVEIERAMARARIEVPGQNGTTPLSPEVAAELRKRSGG